MKAFAIPCSVLLLLLCASLMTEWYVSSSVDQWLTVLSEVEFLVDSDQWLEADYRLERIRHDLLRHAPAYHMFMEHRELNDVQLFFSGVAAACSERDREEFRIFMSQLTMQLTFLAESQRATLQNVL